MIENWWVDLIISAGVLVTGYLFFRFHAEDVGSFENAIKPEIMPTMPVATRSLYPMQLIRQAGLPVQQIRPYYWAAKVIPAILLPLLVAEWIGQSVAGWGLLISSVAGLFLADVWLLARRRSRRTNTRRSLAFLIRLIAIYLNSGMSLSQAFQQAARYGLEKGSPLAEEVLLVTQELDAGMEREEAFDRLALRTGVVEIKRLASVMNVGFRVGSPIRETLETQADLLRARQTQMNSELVNRKTMEAMLPMLLVCFPMFIMLVFFPAAMQFLQVLQLLKEVI